LKPIQLLSCIYLKDERLLVRLPAVTENIVKKLASSIIKLKNGHKKKGFWKNPFCKPARKILKPTRLLSRIYLKDDYFFNRLPMEKIIFFCEGK